MSESGLNDETVVPFDVVQFVRDHRRVIGRISLAAAVMTAIVSGWYFVIQPQRTVASIQFRPTFEGAERGQYPNGLPFHLGDITAPPVIDQVFDKNAMQEYCPKDDFRSGFFVEQRSAELMFLDAEYNGRLSDTRTTAVDRSRLQAEYQSKRESLPLGYRLVFARSKVCASMPPVIMTKALSEVLSVWASDGDVKRGVLRLRVDLLSPTVLDSVRVGDTSAMVRADLLRSRLLRLADNVSEVLRLPGSELVRLGERNVTFSDIRSRLQDMVQSELEPLLVTAGRGLGLDSLAWVEEALASAIREQRLAEGRSKAYLDALREYSGASGPAMAARTELRPTSGAPSDVQALTPQIDRTFVDRIVELSAPNLTFRQEITRAMVQASLDAINSQGGVLHYQHLVESLRRPSVIGLTTKDVEDRLTRITEEGKAVTKQFNELYEELSRVSLRPGAEMYQITGPSSVEVVRGFTFRDYVVTVLGALVGAFLFTTVGFLIWSRLRARTSVAAVR